MRYQSRPRDNEAVLRVLKVLAGRYRRSGYRQLTRMLRPRLGRVNHKRVYRLYRKHGLQVPVRRATAPTRAATTHDGAAVANECWSMDFVRDRTMTGPLRTLSVLDVCTRQAPVLTAARSMPAERVIRSLERAAETYGLPKRIVVDNGPEFTSRAMQRWAKAARHRTSLHRAGQADTERVHRELQRTASRRVPQRARLLGRPRGAAHTRTMEMVLQRRAAARLARRSDAK